MKKIFLSTMILVLGMVLVSCVNIVDKPNRPLPPSDKAVFIYDKKKKTYNASFYAMGTTITLSFSEVEPLLELIDEAAQEMLHIFNFYTILTDNFYPYEGINNVYYINENPGVKIPIVKELYEILKFSDDVRILTDGYFDISIGLIIDQWKSLLRIKEPSAADLSKVINAVDKIPVISDGIKLEQKDDNYYVTINRGVKIDLGAIAKGYATDLANDVAKEYGFKNFRILASDSSVYYGEFFDENRDYFRVGLSNPDYYDELEHNLNANELYGIIRVKNTSVTTSGDDVQNIVINDYRIHHIISPVTKRPENLRRAMTIIDENASLSDALTTALFSMSADVFDKWIEKNPKAVIFYNKDKSKSSYNAEQYIQELF